MPDVLVRRELGAFLRSRRERITPASAGLPRTGRRRTPGLRREELALLAGISATWYTYLEQGRDIRPSDQVLTALATALRLSDYEREHLFRLAGNTTTAQPEQPEEVTPEVAAVPDLVAPNPSYVTGAAYDLLACNQPAIDLFADLINDAGPTNEAERPNLARWMFTSPHARHVLLDWEQEAQQLLARLRATAARYPNQPRFARLIDELQQASPQARAWWPRYDLQPRHSGVKRVRHPRLGPITLGYTAFQVAEQPDQTLVVYSGMPQPTRNPGRRKPSAA
ncbi:MAG TPA: helix-turn-helix transcriptional regulator [Pseudonocardiaceae bacterium]|jgi:transcriptional regulator with XRE-family HTH domain|nr:helix-turn-helix transcriptional regulator [Pseudonocardiaceae bacterium]